MDHLFTTSVLRYFSFQLCIILFHYLWICYSWMCTTYSLPIFQRYIILEVWHVWVQAYSYSFVWFSFAFCLKFIVVYWGHGESPPSEAVAPPHTEMTLNVQGSTKSSHFDCRSCPLPPPPFEKSGYASASTPVSCGKTKGKRNEIVLCVASACKEKGERKQDKKNKREMTRAQNTKGEKRGGKREKIKKNDKKNRERHFKITFHRWNYIYDGTRAKLWNYNMYKLVQVSTYRLQWQLINT